MSSDGSVNLNTVLWASNGTTFSSFGYAACAQYSLAMIASNLTGQCLPLDQSMLAFGDNFTEGMGTYDVAGTPSGSFYVAETYCGTNSDVAPSIFADYWGLQCTESYHNEKSKEETKQMCDEVLDKGGMIWYRYGAGGDVGSGD